MNDEVPFEKWEGLGNDFVCVDEGALPEADWARLAPRLCDRNFGVGADGVLVVGRYPSSMRVFNADGTRPEMCGNGLRCVVAFLARKDGVDVGTQEVRTDAGARSSRFRRADPNTWEVSVDMGRVSFEAPDAGFVGGDAGVPGVGEGVVASVGNPHWVFVDPPADRSVQAEGARLAVDPRFRHGVNVEWVRRLGPSAWSVEVWERGVGPTLACGSGAVAVAATLVRAGLESAGAPIRIALPGGSLVVRVDASGRSLMTGPARRVFAGTLEASFFATPAG